MKDYVCLSLLKGLNYLNHSCPEIYQISKCWLCIVCLKTNTAVLQTYELSLLISALVFLVAFAKVACINIRIRI